MPQPLNEGVLLAGGGKQRQRRFHQRRTGGDFPPCVRIVGDDIDGLVKGRVAGLVFFDQPDSFTKPVEPAFRFQQEIAPGGAGHADPDFLALMATINNTGFYLIIRAAQGFFIALPTGFFHAPPARNTGKNQAVE